MHTGNTNAPTHRYRISGTWPPHSVYIAGVFVQRKREWKGQCRTAVETKWESKQAWVNLYYSTHSIQIQSKRVVSVTTIAGNMIFHYTLCKQCNPSVLSIKMIDCGLSQKKSDTLRGEKVFFLTKRSAFRLPQKVVINVFSLGNPTPLANEGGIYHPHCCGRCREDSNPSAWEQFTFFSLIVPEICDRFGEKHLSRQLLRADTTTHNDHHFSLQTNHSWPESIALHTGDFQRKEKPSELFLQQQNMLIFSSVHMKLSSIVY